MIASIAGLEFLSIENASNLFYSHEKVDSKRIRWNMKIEDNEDTWLLKSESEPLYSCFVINAKECSCLKKNLLIEKDVFLPDECSIRSSLLPRDFHLYPSHLWFSITLHRGNVSLSSSPLRIRSMEVKEMDSFARKGRKKRHNEPLPSSPSSNYLHTDITLVLPITLSDASRVLILFTSLKTIHPPHNIYELLIFTPSYQHSIIQDLLQQSSKSLSFPVKVYSESILYYRPISKWRHANYAIQMSIKLLVARYIKTSYYLTLDADLILLHYKLLTNAVKPFTTTPNNPIPVIGGEDGGGERKEEVYYKGVYNSDPAHNKWWIASQSLLKLDNTQINTKLFTFGVTPVLLSTWGSLMVLSFIEKSLLTSEVLLSHNITSHCYEQENRYFDIRMKGDSHSNSNSNSECNVKDISLFINEMTEKIWLESFNHKFWTEYTLYRISLEYYQVT